MLTSALVKDLIEDGQALISALKDAGLPVTAAFWVKLPDVDVQRLVIASPAAEGYGQLTAYRQLQQILKSLPTLRLHPFDISIMSPNESNYKALLATALGPGRFGMGAAHGKFRNITFEDAYIYEV